MGSAFGFDPGFADNIGHLDALNSLTMNFMMNHIAQTKGAIPEREMDAFRDASAGIAKSQAGNTTNLNFGEAAALGAQERATAMRTWLERYGNLAGFTEAWSKYINDFSRTKRVSDTFDVARANFGNFNSTYLNKGFKGKWTGVNKAGQTVTISTKDLLKQAQARGLTLGEAIRALNLRGQ